jgi:hypothetical protein
MKISLIFLILFSLSIQADAQAPMIITKYSEHLSVYNFTKSLVPSQGENVFKKIFTQSNYNTKKYQDLIAALDTLRIEYSYQFTEYPYGSKVPGMTTGLLKKNLIAANSLESFKLSSVGLIPNKNLVQFTQILQAFTPVYKSLIYEPNKAQFEQQLATIQGFVKDKNLAGFFMAGAKFYGTQWDNSIPLEIVLHPLPNSEGFTAEAFYNIGVSAIQTNLKDYNVLLSVMMHEIFHIQFDEEPLETKFKLESWFFQNPSTSNKYAYLLLNEALATAIGNGYVFEQLSGSLDKGEWYNWPYINQLAKEIYPLVQTYLKEGKSIDQAFVDNYIKIYEQNHPNWFKELNHTMTYRNMLTEHQSDFQVLSKLYPYCSIFEAEDQISEGTIEKIKATPLTKIILVSKDHPTKLALIKKRFPELKDWKYDSKKEFTISKFLDDHTWLYVINQTHSSTESLMKQLK